MCLSMSVDVKPVEVRWQFCSFIDRRLSRCVVSSAGCTDAERCHDSELQRAAELDVGQQRRQSHPRLRAVSSSPSFGRVGVAPAQRRQQVSRRFQSALRLRILVLSDGVQPSRRGAGQSRDSRGHQRLRYHHVLQTYCHWSSARHTSRKTTRIFITARRYASAVYAVVVCLLTWRVARSLCAGWGSCTFKVGTIEVLLVHVLYKL